MTILSKAGKRPSRRKAVPFASGLRFARSGKKYPRRRIRAPAAEVLEDRRLLALTGDIFPVNLAPDAPGNADFELVDVYAADQYDNFTKMLGGPGRGI